MGENEKLRFTDRSKPYDITATTDWVDVGTSATTHWNGNPCGILTVADPTLNQRIARLKSEQECIAEKYKPIADNLVEEIYKSSQKPITLFEEIVQTCKASEETLKAMSKSFPLAFKSPKRKHYKPKFTL